MCVCLFVYVYMCECVYINSCMYVCGPQNRRWEPFTKSAPGFFSGVGDWDEHLRWLRVRVPWHFWLMLAYESIYLIQASTSQLPTARGAYT